MRRRRWRRKMMMEETRIGREEGRDVGGMVWWRDWRSRRKRFQEGVDRF